jgi:hypothetical protein
MLSQKSHAWGQRMQFGQLKRREFVTLLVGATIAWPLTARGQQSGKVWRIGMLDMIAATANSTNLASFRNGLRNLGYSE